MTKYMAKRRNGAPRVVDQLRVKFPDQQWGCVRSGRGAPYWLNGKGDKVEYTQFGYQLTVNGLVSNIDDMLTLEPKIVQIEPQQVDELDEVRAEENRIEKVYQEEINEERKAYKFVRDE